MSALQYVDVPQYSALLLRREVTRAKLSGSIMDRARDWWAGTDVRWSGNTAMFPSGAKIQFGYINTVNDRQNYKSAEYQFIGWDELTEFPLADDETNPYLFLMSRIRRTKDNPAPLRVRSASNPGDMSHEWVKQRFLSEVSLEALRDGEDRIFYEGFRATCSDCGHIETFEKDALISSCSKCQGAITLQDDRAFVPAKIADNPALNAAEYEANLSHLKPVTRARLMNGDWSIREDAIIEADWLRYYKVRGDYIMPLDDEGEIIDQVHRTSMELFAVVDTAGTSKQKAREKKGRPPSWSVCTIWLYHRPMKAIFLVDMWRDRVAWSGLKQGVREVLEKNYVRAVRIENAHHGPALADELSGDFSVQMLSASLGKRSDGSEGAKYERAVASGFLSMVQEGRFFLPDRSAVPGVANMVRDVEAELLSWTGDEEQTADIIDNCSYAASPIKSRAKRWGGQTQDKTATARRF